MDNGRVQLTKRDKISLALALWHRFPTARPAELASIMGISVSGYKELVRNVIGSREYNERVEWEDYSKASDIGDERPKCEHCGIVIYSNPKKEQELHQQNIDGCCPACVSRRFASQLPWEYLMVLSGWEQTLIAGEWFHPDTGRVFDEHTKTQSLFGHKTLGEYYRETMMVPVLDLSANLE